MQYLLEYGAIFGWLHFNSSRQTTMDAKSQM